MRYSKEKTVSHPVAIAFNGCLKSLNQLIHDEDDSSVKVNNQFSESIVIDLDCVESHKAQKERRNRTSTMDCTFAITEGDNTEMLLVEFRFNYINLQNISRTKLIEKVSGSYGALGNSIRINENYIFVFQKNLKAQAVNRLFRMYPRIPNNYIVMDLMDLSEGYF